MAIIGIDRDAVSGYLYSIMITRLKDRSGADTADRLTWRLRSREAAEKAVLDRERRYPILTAANAAEALQYQEDRLMYWMRELN